jgi:hypothetical protein
MAAALAHSHAHPQSPTPVGSRRGVAAVALRVARPDEAPVVDLDAAWADATTPHRIAASRDAHVADVVSLDEVRARRAASPRIRRNRLVAVLFVIGLAVTVQPGQTLWDVAVAHTADGQDPRATMEQLRELNGLDGTQVPAWTPVVLPASLD